MLITILALIIATLVPAVVLYIIYSQDIYGTGEFRNVLLCFIWGVIAFLLAFGLSKVFFGIQLPAAITTTLSDLDLSQYNLWVQFAAPIVEELLKAGILIWLVRRPNFTYFVDGAIYGFAAGMGFAIVENWSYVTSYGDAGLGVAVGRVLSTNLVHATASALVGIALGYSRFQRYQGRLVLLVGGLATAMVLHVGFNNLVTRVSSGLLLLYAAAVGLLGTGFIFYMIRRGLAEQKTWIEEKLGVADRVTDREVAVVQRLSSIDEVLAPLAEQFGPKKAKACERFLTLQARLGIKRKSLDKLTDEKMKVAVQKEMDEIRAEMDEARRSVGAYVMLYLRNIFPQDASPVWKALENAIEQKLKEQQATGGARVNAWAKLGERTTSTRAVASTPEETP